ncbi:hypothetical protein [Mitsuaria sp. PDC51]|uniref:hypothetical protein n=1 Tax=Mitsuaria sp. PDC51 TaxID=1881035 RepID=UPI00113FDD57|nr:hypothetical protein [Mitsuaria sp. PDC51]
MSAASAFTAGAAVATVEMDAVAAAVAASAVAFEAPPGLAMPVDVERLAAFEPVDAFDACEAFDGFEVFDVFGAFGPVDVFAALVGFATGAAFKVFGGRVDDAEFRLDDWALVVFALFATFAGAAVSVAATARGRGSHAEINSARTKPRRRRRLRSGRGDGYMSGRHGTTAVCFLGKAGAAPGRVGIRAPG